MVKCETVEAVHTHTHTSHFSKINKTEDKGERVAFICDRLKDRSKAIF